MKHRKITKVERMVGRSDGYYGLSPSEQWSEDKRLGLLDWDGSKPKKEKRTVPASSFVGTLAANVDNKMSDADFRQFVRNTLPIVQYDGCDV